MSSDNGGTAFPNPGTYYIEAGHPKIINEAVSGMSLADWLAGQTLVGVVSSSETESELRRASDNVEQYYKILSAFCYRHADALIAEKRRREAEGVK
jgi:hypothetical protein